MNLRPDKILKMKKGIGLMLAVVNCWLWASCDGRRVSSVDQPDSLMVKYAKGFTIRELSNGSKLVEVSYPYQGAKSGYKYLLVKKGVPVPVHDGDVAVIPIPIESIVCTSTTHVPLLDYLNETDKLVGFPSPDYISSEKMRRRIDEEKVMDLDMDKKMNVEKLYLLKPDLVMGYTMTSDLGPLKKVKE
jgi:iron complex transport system substrate-binding protein